MQRRRRGSLRSALARFRGAHPGQRRRPARRSQESLAPTPVRTAMGCALRRGFSRGAYPDIRVTLTLDDSFLAGHRRRGLRHRDPRRPGRRFRLHGPAPVRDAPGGCGGAQPISRSAGLPERLSRISPATAASFSTNGRHFHADWRFGRGGVSARSVRVEGALATNNSAELPVVWALAVRLGLAQKSLWGGSPSRWRARGASCHCAQRLRAGPGDLFRHPSGEPVAVAQDRAFRGGAGALSRPEYGVSRITAGCAGDPVRIYSQRQPEECYRLDERRAGCHAALKRASSICFWPRLLWAFSARKTHEDLAQGSLKQYGRAWRAGSRSGRTWGEPVPSPGTGQDGAVGTRGTCCFAMSARTRSPCGERISGRPSRRSGLRTHRWSGRTPLCSRKARRTRPLHLGWRSPAPRGRGASTYRRGPPSRSHRLRRHRRRPVPWLGLDPHRGRQDRSRLPRRRARSALRRCDRAAL